MDNRLIIKQATKEDAGVILEFIEHLAEYEKLSHEVKTNIDRINSTIFCESPKAFCILGYENNVPVVFAIYFFNYSTFLGKYGLYLEDLFVLPEHRGKGYGKQMLIKLAEIAKENNCGRFEWWVLDWNEPAIKFYENLGAKAMDEWTVYRLDEKGISNLINQKNSYGE